MKLNMKFGHRGLSSENPLFKFKQCISKYYLILLYLLFGAFVLSEFLKLFKEFLSQPYFTRKDLDLSREEKIILLWNGNFENFDTNLIINNKKIKTELKISCPKTNCYVTTNRKYLDDIKQYNGIIFYGTENWPIEPRPANRSRLQKYIFAAQDSQKQIILNTKLSSEFFNWTMTYMRDSQILWQKYGIIDKSSKKFVVPSTSLKWRDVDSKSDITLIPIVESKTKMAAWHVFDCELEEPKSKLFAGLWEKFNVSVHYHCQNISNIEQFNDYKYNIIVENEYEHCYDYVSDEFYNFLNLTTIPVVFGGADYGQFAPPRSFINANDFKDINELSKFLLNLSKNKSEYLKYFWWKKFYHIKEYTSHAFCDLCTKISDPAVVKKPDIYYSMTDWLDRCSQYNSFIKL